MNNRPILLVHGIWRSGADFDAMQAALKNAQLGPTTTLDLFPNDGSCTIVVRGEQVQRLATDLARSSNDGRIDVVGFSMGALITRYWIQKRGGKHCVRRFVSISGPHHGTWLAHFSRQCGVVQMRPNSPLLQQLWEDHDPWGDVAVYSFWTPFDLMIMPPHSSHLPAAVYEAKYPVRMHHLMIRDRRVLSAVIEVLEAEGPKPAQ